MGFDGLRCTAPRGESVGKVIRQGPPEPRLNEVSGGGAAIRMPGSLTLP